MVLSRILGDVMSLLFSLRFLGKKSSRIKAAGHFNIFSVHSCTFRGFYRHIISTLQEIRVCDYSFLSCLQRRFLTINCCSIQMISIGGEFNDFNK